MPRRRPETPEQARDRELLVIINDHINSILDVAADRIDQLDLYDGYDGLTRTAAADIVRDMKRHPE